MDITGNSPLERMAKAGDARAKDTLLRRVQDAKRAGRECYRAGLELDHEWLLTRSGMNFTEREAYRQAWYYEQDQEDFRD